MRRFVTAALMSLLAAACAGTTATDVPGGAARVEDPNTRPPLVVRSERATTTTLATTARVNGVRVTTAGSVAERGEPMLIEADGFAVDSRVRVVLQPESIELVDTVTDDTGLLSVIAVVPLGISIGAHTLVIDGTASDGSRLRHGHAINVGAAIPPPPVVHAPSLSKLSASEDASLGRGGLLYASAEFDIRGHTGIVGAATLSLRCVERCAAGSAPTATIVGGWSATEGTHTADLFIEAPFDVRPGVWEGIALVLSMRDNEVDCSVRYSASGVGSVGSPEALCDYDAEVTADFAGLRFEVVDSASEADTTEPIGR